VDCLGGVLPEMISQRRWNFGPPSEVFIVGPFFITLLASCGIFGSKMEKSSYEKYGRLDNAVVLGHVDITGRCTKKESQLSGRNSLAKFVLSYTCLIVYERRTLHFLQSYYGI
jgi:hypothetical protein